MNITPIFTERELKFIRYALSALHGGLTYGDVNYKQREADLKLTNYGAKGWFMIVLFHKMFVAVQYWYPIQERVGSEFFNLRKRVCKLYDTFGKFDKPQEQPKEDPELKSRIAAFNQKRSESS